MNNRSVLPLQVLVIAGALAITGSVPAQVARGLSCFRIAISDPKASQPVEGTGGSISYTGCRMRTPAASLCLRTLTEAGDAGGEVPNWYLCYRVKCPSHGGFSMTVADDLGSHPLRLRTAQTLCKPVMSFRGRVTCLCADQSTVMTCIPDCLTDFEVCDQVCANHGGAAGGGSCAETACS